MTMKLSGFSGLACDQTGVERATSRTMRRMGVPHEWGGSLLLVGSRVVEGIGEKGDDEAPNECSNSCAPESSASDACPPISDTAMTRLALLLLPAALFVLAQEPPKTGPQ